MTRLSRPLNEARVKAADAEFYANHHEFIKRNGERIPLSETNPAQADLRREWVRAYQKQGGEIEPKDQYPMNKPDTVVQECPAKALQSAKPASSTPKIVDASESEKKTIEKAQERAKAMTDAAITKCLEQAKSQPNELVKKYFGIAGTSDADKEKIDALIGNYEKIRTGLDSETYEVEQEDIEPGKPYTVAYVRTLPFIHGFGHVHVNFPAFDTQSQDDQAGTLVHEMSHYAVGTDDHAYDWETSKWRKLSQAQQMDNADSYGNFARDCYRAAPADK